MSSSDVSMEVVVEAIKETLSKVHISDGVMPSGNSTERGTWPKRAAQWCSIPSMCI